MTIRKLRIKIAVTALTILGFSPPNITLSQPVYNWDAGGVIDINDSVVSADNINLAAPLTLNIANNKVLDLQGNITLASPFLLTNITKQGAGTLILSGNNSAVEKNNHLQQGSIIVANSNSLGGGFSNLYAHRGTLFEYKDGVTIVNSIHINDDAFPLDPIEQADNLNLNPNAVTWMVDSGNTATQLANIHLSANTPLVKTGEGELIINADAVTPNGLFEVDQGSLVVERIFTGFITLKNNSKLSGNGFIDNLTVNDNSTVAPTGKLSINNHIQFGNNSTLQIRTWSDGNNDSVHSKQTAHLSGRVLVMPQGNANNWGGDSYDYVILQADDELNLNPNGGLNNTRFDTVESSVPYLEPSLRYTPNQVLLNLKPVKFNQGNNSNNYTNNHAWVSNTKAMLIEDSRFVRQFALRSKPSNNKIWFESFYSDADVGLKTNRRHTKLGLNSIDHIDRQIGGLFIGVNLLDKINTSKQTSIKTNLITGYTNSHIRGYGTISDPKSDPKSDINSYHIGIINSYKNDIYGIKLGLSHSNHKIKYQRLSTALTSKQTQSWGHNVNSRASAKLSQIFLKTSFNLTENVKPYIDIAHIRYADKGFKESGGALAVNTKRQKINQTLAGLGLDVTISLNDSAKLNMGLAYSHTFGKMNPSSKQHYRYDVLKTSMTAKSSVQKRNNFDFNLGVDAELNDIGGNKSSYGLLKNAWLGIEYSGRYSRKAKDHGVRVGLRAVF